jgi:hypothetical protein
VGTNDVVDFDAGTRTTITNDSLSFITMSAAQIDGLPEAPNPSTPANEWASKTNSALHLDTQDDEKSNVVPVPSSAVSTPGPMLPGAYPPTPAALTDETDVTHGRESSIIPTIQEAVLSASETARQYFPAQVAAYLRKCSISDFFFIDPHVFFFFLF